MLFHLVLQDTLNELQPVRGEEGTYICDVCKKAYRRKYILKKYQCVHSGKRPFCCYVCNKSFSQKHTLMIHQRIHSGERPFCFVCNKSFSHEPTLVVHQRIRSGVRPFCYDVSNKSLSDLRNMKSRRHIHMGRRSLLLCVAYIVISGCYPAMYCHRFL
jgi:uncharacterized Zn-finger protein